tara:strand:+ start:12962 stop:13915 length:954 start_codon:yes stop_codon:yes gene_type:complete
VISLLNLEPNGFSSHANKILKSFSVIKKGPLSRKKLIGELENYDALIVRLSHKIDKQIIDAGRNLKVISSATTGLDHIDLKYAHEKNIKVLSLQGEYKFLNEVHATAEHTWALILALTRKICSSYESVKNNQWDRDNYKGTELKNSTLGIVGFGRIGKKISNYAIAFGMNVVVFNDKKIASNNKIIQERSLSRLLKKSDVLSIHVPLSDTTRNMFSMPQFKMMKKNSIIINTSRGEIINEIDLINAIKNKIIHGAALDVIHNESKFMSNINSEIIDFAKTNDRVVITPHIGGATYESMEKTEIFMANKLLEYFKKFN